MFTTFSQILTNLNEIECVLYTEHISHHYLFRIQIDKVNTELELTVFKSYLHLGIAIAFAWFNS